MPTFLLIDQSLRSLGGHHFPYAWNLLSAAEAAGWQPVLATHRDFAERAALPAHWRLHALFRNESYSRHTLDIQALRGDATGPRAALAATRGVWSRLRAAWAARARARHATAFATDCAALFAREAVGSGDLVFCATTSELDLAGLAQYLATRTPQPGLHWHLQFHFGVYGGRDPGYARQRPAAQALHEVFTRALAKARGHALHLHCTTPELCAQYETLGVGPFHTLPYPVHEGFAPRALPATSGPLRIACLGHSRREKGYQALPELLAALWDDWFGSGRARLVLQTHQGRQRHALESLVRRLGNAAALEFAPFPLPLAGYTELLRGADLGLMLYDPTRYYARCSGVLLEMQCAGVPVLVPAGSWLAGQIEPANQLWLAGLAARLGDLAPCTAQPGPALPGHELWLEPAAGTRSLLLDFAWEQPQQPGRYLEVQAWPQDQAGPPEKAAPLRRIMGARPDGGVVRLLLALPAQSVRLRIAWCAAWQDDAAPPAQLVGYRASAERLPAGAVGLCFADGSQLNAGVAELLEHHEHYLAGARASAAGCRASQGATQVLAQLLACHGASTYHSGS